MSHHGRADAAGVSACYDVDMVDASKQSPRPAVGDGIRGVERLGFPWQTQDPFLFCVHHDDKYPAGNAQLGPKASLAGRNLGMDFEGRDGWRMYHGDVVPGFPQHPHRGFETVTLARSGFIDHSDSLGATARFGRGDAQWMTAGQGIVHAEMFPLLDENNDNPLELFQIWLNLPRDDKMVEPHFAMLWNEDIPRLAHDDENGKRTTVTAIAGGLAGEKPPSPPPHSWAARDDADVAIATFLMDAGARYTLPPAWPGTLRTLYFFQGPSLRLNEVAIPAHSAIKVDGKAAVEIVAGDAVCELLLLQGRPIGEPVAHYGPFVMTNKVELEQAFLDFQRTQFGGWPWPGDAPVHPRAAGRFAVHADGRREER